MIKNYDSHNSLRSLYQPNRMAAARKEDCQYIEVWILHTQAQDFDDDECSIIVFGTKEEAEVNAKDYVCQHYPRVCDINTDAPDDKSDLFEKSWDYIKEFIEILGMKIEIKSQCVKIPK